MATLTFDTTAEDASNTPLEVWNTSTIVTTEMGFPTPPLETATTGSIDTEGDSIAARRHQNRTLSLTLEIVASSTSAFRTAVAALEAKMAKLATSGGTLTWVNDAAESFTFDVLATDQYDKALDIAYFAGPVAIATLQLTARPYARGAEVTLSAHTTLSWGETITGDVPATGRLVVTDTATQDHADVLWGIDPKNTGTYWLQAEAASIASQPSSALAATSGASGSGNNSVTTDIATASTWQTGMVVTADRIGSYRVLARVRLPTANAGSTSIRLSWRGAGIQSNSAVPVTPKNTWLLVDLGIVSAAKNRHGQNQLTLYPEVLSTTAHDDIIWDAFLLLPIGYASGEFYGTTGFVFPASSAIEFADDGVLVNDSGSGTWRLPSAMGGVYEGDNLRLPTNEGGQFAVVARVVRGLVNGSIRDDTIIDSYSSQLFYTPRWLNVR